MQLQLSNEHESVQEALLYYFLSTRVQTGAIEIYTQLPADVCWQVLRFIASSSPENCRIVKYQQGLKVSHIMFRLGIGGVLNSACIK